MTKSTMFLLGLAVVVTASVGWIHAQSTGSHPQAPGRFTVTSTSNGTILLDSSTGDTWRLNVGPQSTWEPISRAGTRQAATRLRFTASNWARVSPFTKVEFLSDDEVQVEFKGRKYELLSMDELSTNTLLEASRNVYGGLWQKRFVEDIVEVMEAAGRRPGNTVRLTLRDTHGKTIVVDGAPMTSENRQAAYRARNLPGAASANLFSANPFFSGVPGYPSWSAFTGIEWKGEQPVVQVDGAWYELVCFHGVSVSDIQSACQKNGWPYQHRFTEDLVQIMRLLGHKIDRTADLELRDKEGNVVIMKGVTMSEENQRQLLRSERRPVVRNFFGALGIE